MQTRPTPSRRGCRCRAAAARACSTAAPSTHSPRLRGERCAGLRAEAAGGGGGGGGGGGAGAGALALLEDSRTRLDRQCLPHPLPHPPTNPPTRAWPASTAALAASCSPSSPPTAATSGALAWLAGRGCPACYARVRPPIAGCRLLSSMLRVLLIRPVLSPFLPQRLRVWAARGAAAAGAGQRPDGSADRAGGRVAERRQLRRRWPVQAAGGGLQAWRRRVGLTARGPPPTTCGAALQPRHAAPYTPACTQTIAGVVFCPIDIVKQRVQTQQVRGGGLLLLLGPAAAAAAGLTSNQQAACAGRSAACLPQPCLTRLARA